MVQQNIVPIILTQKQKKIICEVILMMYLNQFIVKLNQTKKKHLQKVRFGLLFQL